MQLSPEYEVSPSTGMGSKWLASLRMVDDQLYSASPMSAHAGVHQEAPSHSRWRVPFKKQENGPGDSSRTESGNSTGQSSYSCACREVSCRLPLPKAKKIRITYAHRASWLAACARSLIFSFILVGHLLVADSRTQSPSGMSWNKRSPAKILRGA